MYLKIRKTMVQAIIGLFVLNIGSYAQDITLPQPQKSGGMPLMEAINNRQSIREFSNKEIPLQVLSDLLWAANGFNRPEENKRTVPTAGNCQNISVYVAMANGLYLYEATNHLLTLISEEDIRAETGPQSFVKDVPVNLVYVADLEILSSLLPGTSKDIIEFFSSAHVGFISQNVYLYCASFGLATVVRGLIHTEDLHTTMDLEADQKVILMQSIGYPAESSLINISDSNPDSYLLFQNYPNPFNPSTIIKYSIKEPSNVTVKIYNLAGQEIADIFNGFQPAGDYEINWQPQGLASGIYFYQLQAGENSVTRKLIYQK